MVSARLVLLGSALCLSACTAARYPNIRPVISHAEAQESPFEQAYADGKAELAGGHPGLAIVAFERAVRLDPASVEALNGIGAAYDELKRFDIAMVYYQRALALAPRDAATMNNIAVSLRLSGNSAAADWLDKASKIAPSNAVIAANIAQAKADNASAAGKHEPAADPAGVAVPVPVPDEAPKIERSGVDTFQLGVASGANPPVRAAEPPAPPPAIPVIPRIEAVPLALPVVAKVEPLAVPPAVPAAARTEGPTAPLAVPVAARIEAPDAGMAPRATPIQPASADPSLPTTVNVAVSNCVGRTGMAKRFRAFFRAEGLPVRHITNSPPFDCLKTRLLAHAGHELQVQAMVRLIPQPVEIETDDTIADEIRLVLGRDLVDFDHTLGD
jgi:hypothetical protein